MRKKLGLRLVLVYIISIAFYPCVSSALRDSQPMSIDKRLRVMVYNPNDVFKFTGFYGYESSIVFSPEETIDTITMGDSVAWQVVPSGNRLFLKPVETEATTNMTLITNKRVYHFELHAQYAKDISDPNLIFALRFLYPDEDGNNSAVQQYAVENDLDIDGKEKNYNYTVSGKESIVPIKIFDDGTRTYLEFSNKDQDIPSFFVVYNDGSEGIVNYSIIENYIVIEKVAERFTLRRGEEVGCIFNEKLLSKKTTKKNMNEDKNIFSK